MKYRLQHYWGILRYELPNFFRSLWIFRKALWNYRWYGGHYSVFTFMADAIKDIALVMTSSPFLIFNRIADISKACVQLCVREIEFDLIFFSIISSTLC